jgi:hypothetical protein
MSFAKCPYCKTLVDRQAVACPHCTRDLASAGLWKLTFFEKIISFVTAVAVITYFFGGAVGAGLGLLLGFLAAICYVVYALTKIEGFFIRKIQGSPQSATTSNSEPSEETHIRCVRCYEYVLPQASKCKHCGTDLIPDEEFELRKVKPGFDLDAWMSLNPLRGLVVAFSLLILACTYTGYAGYLLVSEIWKFWTRS